MFPKKHLNSVNTDTPCCKKVKTCENFHENCYVARFKKFIDYETASAYQFCNFS